MRLAVMPSNSLMTWYHAIVLAVAVGVIYSNLPTYAYVRNPALLPKFFFFALFFLIVPLLLIRSKALSVYVVSPFAMWASMLMILNIVHFACAGIDSNLSPGSIEYRHAEERAALILARVQYVGFAWFLGFAVYASHRPWYRYIFVLLAIVLPCFVVLDFLKPGLLYPLETSGAVLGRAAAMFINPTMAGEALVLVFLMSCTATVAKYRVLLFILLGAGVLVTFSRSSMIAWLLLWPMLTVGRVLPRMATVVLSALFAAALLSFGAFESYLGQRADFGVAIDNLLARLDFFSHVSLADGSAQERAAAVKAGWELFLENPIFGAGAGVTQFWSLGVSTHNQLLLMAAEYGILGIALWLWLVTILWRGQFFQNRSLQVTATFLFVFMSMFTHLMLDAAAYWMATFALISTRQRSVTVYVPGVYYYENRPVD
jgi:hypothetical protein